MKSCVDCGIELPASEFYKSRNRDGLSSYCKPCTRARTVAWQKANPERHRAKGRRYIAKDRERHNARGRAWGKANPERAAANTRAWRTANRERFTLATAAWRDENREHIRELKRHHENLRRSRVASVAIVDFTVRQWAEMVTAFDGRCAYCQSPGRLTQDHIVPISKGGNHTRDNILPVCGSCNSSKGSKDLEEWLAARAS